MKKLLVGMMVAVMGLSMTASALPAVTVDDNCALFGPLPTLFGTATIVDQHYGWIAVLGMADIDEISGSLPVDAADADLEFQGINEDETFDLGDGIPDLAQLNLLFAAACADSGLMTGLNGNVAQVSGMLGKLAAVVQWADSDVVEGQSQLGATVANIALAVQIPQLAAYANSLNTLATYINLAKEDIVGNVNGNSSAAVIVAGLGNVPAELAGLASTSSEMKALMDQLMVALVGSLNEAVDTPLGALTPGQICALIASQITPQLVGTLDAAGTGYGVPLLNTLADQLSAAAAYLGAGATVLGEVSLPSFTVLGTSSKLASEPFSALGDYNGDGVNNLDMWGLAGGDVNKFVAQASGSDPWWTGNPNMPAVGLVGLAALIGAITAGGATVLRKK